MATYYVAPTGVNTNPGTEALPFRAITKAASVVNPGDTVIVKAGSYNAAIVMARGGNATAPVVFRGEEGALIRPPATSWNAISVLASYIRIEGFDIANAKGDGIEANGVHHIEIVGNTISNCGESGIQTNQADFITIERNKCFNNASTGWFSGISLYQNRAIGGAGEGFRNIVRGNVCYGNVTKTGEHTDGNGIIIDDFQSTQTSGFPNYAFPTLVEGNTCYLNGGKGIQVTWSDNVTVRGNICWRNNQDPLNKGTWRGELSNSMSSGGTWENNIGVADPTVNSNNTAIDNTSYGTYKNTNVTWRGNTTFNGTPGQASVRTDGDNPIPSVTENKLGVDPKFAAPPADFSVAAPPPPPPPEPDPAPDPTPVPDPEPVVVSPFLWGVVLGVIFASMEKELMEDGEILTVADVKDRIRALL